MVDLGEGYSAHPTHYSLGYASQKNFAIPRHWLLQATNEIKVSIECFFLFIFLNSLSLSLSP
jgi:hypothetical protein